MADCSLAVLDGFCGAGLSRSEVRVMAQVTLRATRTEPGKERRA